MKKATWIAVTVFAASVPTGRSFAQGIGGVTAAAGGVTSGASMPSLQTYPSTGTANLGKPNPAPGVPTSVVSPATGLPQTVTPGPAVTVPATSVTGTSGMAAPAMPATSAQGSAVAAMPPLTPAQARQMAKDLELMSAAFAGETWKARNAVAKGANVNARDWQYGLTPLMWASARGNLGTVRYLLSKSARANAQSRRGVPVLLAQGRKSVTPMGTTDNGTNVAWQQWMLLRARDGGVTPLLMAAGGGYNMTVRELLAHGADPNMTEAEGGTPLMLAAFSGNVMAVRALLGKGAKINAVDPSNTSALYFAAVEGNTAVVRELLARGAWADLKPVNGYTAAAAARMRGFNDVAKLLEKAMKTQKPHRSPLQDAEQPTSKKLPPLTASGDNVVILN